MRKVIDEPTEMLLGRIFWTRTGHTVSLEDARRIFGSYCIESVREGYFWIPCTQRSAENIRENGHESKGVDISVFMPRQTEIAFKATGIKELEAV